MQIPAVPQLLKVVVNDALQKRQKHSVCYSSIYQLTEYWFTMLVDEAADKANSKKIAAQKSADHAEKRLHKKAKTEEITRCRTNQENQHSYSH